MAKAMARGKWLAVSALLAVSLVGCKQQSVVLSEEELKSFKEGAKSGSPSNQPEPRRPDSVDTGPPNPDTPVQNEPNAEPAPPSANSGMTSPPNSGRPSGGGGLGVNPGAEASNPPPGRPNNTQRPSGPPQGNPGMRQRRATDQVETSDFTVNGSRVAVTGVFKLEEGKVLAWKADGSPNAALKGEVEAQLKNVPQQVLDRMSEGPGGDMVYVISQVTGGTRPSMVQSEFGGFGGMGRMFGGNAAGRIMSVAAVESGASTISVRYRVEEQAAMTANIPFKEGSSVKMGSGNVTLQSIGDGAAPETGESQRRPMGGADRTPTAFLVFLKSGLPRAPFSLQLIGKDGKPFTLIDKDGKPTAMPEISPGGQPGPNLQRLREMRPAYFVVGNDEGSVVVNLLVKKELVSSVKVTLAPQKIIERKGIAAHPK